MQKILSFGGLGDSYLVLLKVLDLAKKDDIDWLHVESNEIVPQMVENYINNYMKLLCDWPCNIKISTECDGKYQENFFKGKWKDRIPLNTSVNGDYNFPQGDEGIKNPFLIGQESSFFPFDVCLQVSAGAKANRKWKFDLYQLVNFLRNKNISVALVGTGSEFENKNDPYNYVNKKSLADSMHIINMSQVYIGLSGFFTYWSLSQRKKNIHCSESKNHDKHYIHSQWEDYRYRIEYGSIGEIIKGLKYWGYNI